MNLHEQNNQVLPKVAAKKPIRSVLPASICGILGKLVKKWHKKDF
ncbi:Uncharacterised protein [uncultured archaeon]|nr:Uncharacterised protein [uncultured archaeon]